MEPWIMPTVWGIIFLGTLVLEIVTSDIDSIWFTASSVVCLILSIFVSTWWIQVIVFVVLSVVLIIATRPITKKMMDREIISTNADKVIGQTGVITQAFEGDSVGEVRIEGQLWRCINRDQLSFSDGEKVKIEGISGNKVVIKKTLDNQTIVNL